MFAQDFAPESCRVPPVRLVYIIRQYVYKYNQRVHFYDCYLYVYLSAHIYVYRIYIYLFIHAYNVQLPYSFIKFWFTRRGRRHYRRRTQHEYKM